MKAPLIIADDHALFRSGLRRLLESEGYAVVAEAATGDEALEAARKAPAGSVVLLDIGMPGLDGVEVTRRLSKEGVAARVIILSAREDRDALFSAMAAGARGYIAKEADPTQLFAAIEVVAGGGAVLSEQMATNFGEGIREMDYEPGDYERRRHDLSPRELEVLRLLATRKTPAQIAASLFLSTKTVQNHVSSIYRKLGVRNRAEAVIKGMELHLIAGSG
jgi:DNA-binding NarL/FixJ family response regulator